MGIPGVTHIYTGAAPCGCVVAMCVDDPKYRKDIKEFVQNGYALNRVPVGEETWAKCDAHKGLSRDAWHEAIEDAFAPLRKKKPKRAKQPGFGFAYGRICEMKDQTHHKVDRPDAPWKTHAQWMQSAGGKYLHFVAPLTEDEDEHDRACSAPGVPRIALCGIRMRCFIPGLGMRMGGARCERCCDKMSLPWGYGTPANEVARWRRFFEEENECLSLT